MIKQNRLKPILLVLILAFSVIHSSCFAPQAEAATIRSIIFPVLGKSSYSNDYNAPRDGGTRVHHAIDILANKGQRLVSAVNGTIVDVQYPQPNWGYSVTIRDAQGYQYRYIHMNDDNPRTNDGKGGGMHAYAVDVKEGNRVVRGQLIGWVGDSGRANGIPHLHFEMFGPKGKVMNPYESLKRATRISSPKNYSKLANEILPNGTKFKSRLSLDMGNFDLDEDPEIVAGAGAGGSYVKMFEVNGASKGRFAPNNTSFKGGSDVAAGNVDGDPTDEIITSAGPGGSYVKIFETDGTSKSRFAPYGTGFKGGIFVAAGDVDNDGVDEIITGAGKTGGPRVSVFELDGTPINTFYAFSQGFKGGIDVAAGDVDNDGVDEIITGAGPGGGPHVAIWELNGTEIDDFYPYSRDFRGGVRVSAGNVRTVNPEDEVITVPASKGNPTIRMFNKNGSSVGSYYFMEQWWRGFHDVGATEGTSMASTGVNRRDSIRHGIE
ncbi:MAG: peptidoglycan DD-metalloendopeptidase family protein [Candidatus Saccharimonadales bacterium]